MPLIISTGNANCLQSDIRLALTIALLFLLGGQSIASARTCSLSVQSGTSDSNFDSIFTQNGAGTGLEPLGSPGWTGADSTYSIQLPNGDSAFFFSDSYIGESPAKTGDGTVRTDTNGLRTRLSNCDPPLCDPPTNLYRAHNSVVVRNALTGTLTTLVGPIDPVS